MKLAQTLMINILLFSNLILIKLYLLDLFYQDESNDSIVNFSLIYSFYSSIRR